MSTAFERFVTTKHLPGLDGLRCLAILPVVWHHATPRPLPGILGKGAVGVDLFFALSGFLITTLLLRERRAQGRIGLSRFYARRSLRIFPLYYLVLSAYVVWALAFGPGTPQTAHFLRNLPYHASYTANWFVDYDVPHDVVFAFSWTLCVEEQFYWAWPCFLALLPQRRVLGIVMLSALAVDWSAEHGLLTAVAPPGSTLLRVLKSFATPIGCGSLLALALDSERGFRWCWVLLGQRWSAPLTLMVAVSLLALPSTPHLLLSLILTVLVGAVAVRRDSGLAWILERRAVRWIGMLSYGVYLLHVTALGLVRRVLPAWREDAVVMFASALPLSLVLAWVTFTFVERPLQRFRSRFH